MESDYVVNREGLVFMDSVIAELLLEHKKKKQNKRGTKKQNGASNPLKDHWQTTFGQNGVAFVAS